MLPTSAVGGPLCHEIALKRWDCTHARTAYASISGIPVVLQGTLSAWHPSQRVTVFDPSNVFVGVSLSTQLISRCVHFSILGARDDMSPVDRAVFPYMSFVVRGEFLPATLGDERVSAARPWHIVARLIVFRGCGGSCRQ